MKKDDSRNWSKRRRNSIVLHIQTDETTSQEVGERTLLVGFLNSCACVGGGGHVLVVGVMCWWWGSCVGGGGHVLVVGVMGWWWGSWVGGGGHVLVVGVMSAFTLFC
ncbi:unnamed protein product [Lota lota]